MKHKKSKYILVSLMSSSSLRNLGPKMNQIFQKRRSKQQNMYKFSFMLQDTMLANKYYSPQPNIDY